MERYVLRVKLYMISNFIEKKLKYPLLIILFYLEKKSVSKRNCLKTRNLQENNAQIYIQMDLHQVWKGYVYRCQKSDCNSLLDQQVHSLDEESQASALY